MKVVKRWKKIESLLNKSGSLSIKELTEQLGVSETTIRRDLVEMEKNNMIRRLWGGATVSNITNNETANLQDAYLLKFQRNTDIKRALAQYAASLIKDNSCFFLDAGSTTSFIPEYIEANNVTIVTNSINNFQTLAQKNISVYVPNGYINYGAAAIMSSETSEQLSKMNFDIAFIGTGGIDARAGFSTRNEHDASLKQSVIARCDNTYIISDSSKFGQKTLYTFAKINDIPLITNEKPSFPIDNIILVDKQQTQV